MIGDQTSQDLAKNIEVLNYRVAIMNQQASRLTSGLKNGINKILQMAPVQSQLVTVLIATNRAAETRGMQMLSQMSDLALTVKNAGKLYDTAWSVGLKEMDLQTMRQLASMDLLGADIAGAATLLQSLRQTLGFSNERSLELMVTLQNTALSYGTSVDLLIEAINQIAPELRQVAVAFGAEAAGALGGIASELTAILPGQRAGIQALVKDLLAGTAKSQTSLFALGLVDLAPSLRSEDRDVRMPALEKLFDRLETVRRMAGTGEMAPHVLESLTKAYDISIDTLNLSRVMSETFENGFADISNALQEQAIQDTLQMDYQKAMDNIRNELQSRFLPLLTVAAEALSNIGGILNSVTTWMIGGAMLGAFMGQRLWQSMFWLSHMIDLRTQLFALMHVHNKNLMVATYKASNRMDLAATVDSVIQKEHSWKLSKIAFSTLRAAGGAILMFGLMGLILGAISFALPKILGHNEKSESTQRNILNVQQQQLELAKEKTQRVSINRMSLDMARSVLLLSEIVKENVMAREASERTAEATEVIADKPLSSMDKTIHAQEVMIGGR